MSRMLPVRPDVAALVLAAAFLAAAVPAQAETAEPVAATAAPIVRTFDVEAKGSFSLDVDVANIEVTTGPKVKLTLQLRDGSKPSEVQWIYDQLDSRGVVLKLRTGSRKDRQSVIEALRVEVPEGLACSVVTAKGDVTGVGLGKSARLRSRAGNVTTTVRASEPPATGEGGKAGPRFRSRDSG